jgi:hypothetical protein
MSVRSNASKSGLPQNAIPSMATYFQSLNGLETEEKALMIRMGVLIDAIVESERGMSNIGSAERRELDAAQKTPEGEVNNVLRSVQINLDPTDSKNLSHYEVQTDTDSNFSDPTSFQSFKTDLNIKGLTTDQNYSVRVRSITKAGLVSLWNTLGTVLVTAFRAILQSTAKGTSASSGTMNFPASGLELWSGGLFFVDNFANASTSNDNSASLTLYVDAIAEQTITLRGYNTTTSTQFLDQKKLGTPVFFDTVTGLASGDHTFLIEESYISGGTIRTTETSVEPAIWIVF